MIGSRAYSGWGVTAYVKTRFLVFRVQKKFFKIFGVYAPQVFLLFYMYAE